TLRSKADEFDDLVKTGRTHLMDAMPVRLGQEFGGYAGQIAHGITRVEMALGHLAELAIGGTAVGTGVNTHPKFGARVAAALTRGSSIMPGKINPVIPEVVAMVAAQVTGNDVAITIGGQSGSFELNVMLPVIAYNLLQSIALLSTASRALADRAVAGLKPN